MLVRPVLQRALRTIGALAQGETASPGDIQAALSVFQAMLSGWQTQRLTIPVISREVFDLAAGIADYTIGPSGDWDRDLTPFVLDHAAELVSGTEARIEIFTAQRWQALTDKSTAGSIIGVSLSRTQPLPTVSVYHVPEAAGEVVLYIPTPLNQPIDLDTDLLLLDGYEEAYLYNLCLRLAPEFGKTLDPLMRSLATDSKHRLEALQIAPVEWTIDPALQPRYSHADWWG